MNTAIYEYLAKIIPKENIHLDEPMNRHTTFRIGGNAKALLEIENEEQLIQVLKLLWKVDEAYFILGNGSNLLVGDKGYQGIVIQIASKMSQIIIEHTTMRIKAGALLSQAANAAWQNELTGLEFASGIPGTIGGAVVMNAGAYGGEMKAVVSEVKVLSAEGEVLVLDNETMEFSYRSSVIRNRKFVVLEVTLQLQEGDREVIGQKMAQLTERRKEKQPLEYPSAGSTFKRPEGHFAGKLIMESQMQGFRIGDAQISEKHCGFVVNLGSATAKDILSVIKEVQERIFEKFGVTLEMEVICLGDF